MNQDYSFGLDDLGNLVELDAEVSLAEVQPKRPRAKKKWTHKLDTEMYIAMAKAKHGDKYDYSKTVYLKHNVKIVVTCPKHGDFETLPYTHLKCQCRRCYVETLAGNKGNPLYDLNGFIEAAKAKHGNKYDYSKVVWVRSEDRVCIICPEHGPLIHAPRITCMRRKEHARSVVGRNASCLEKKNGVRRSSKSMATGTTTRSPNTRFLSIR